MTEQNIGEKLTFSRYAFSGNDLSSEILSKIREKFPTLQNVDIDIVVLVLEENPDFSRYVVSLSKQDLLYSVTDRKSARDIIKGIHRVVNSPFLWTFIVLVGVVPSSKIKSKTWFVVLLVFYIPKSMSFRVRG